MKINESSIDGVIRIFSGVLLLYLGFGGELFDVLAVIADILGVIPLLTGVIGFCLLPVLFKFKSRRKEPYMRSLGTLLAACPIYI